MKKTRALLFLFVVSLLAMLLVSCADYSEPSGKAGVGKFYFHAEVVEVHNGYIMVTPVEGAAQGRSSDLIDVSLTLRSGEVVSGVEKGDTVRIIYNGEIMESYPARIAKAFDIIVISE